MSRRKEEDGSSAYLGNAGEIGVYTAVRIRRAVSAKAGPRERKENLPVFAFIPLAIEHEGRHLDLVYLVDYRPGSGPALALGRPRIGPCQDSNGTNFRLPTTVNSLGPFMVKYTVCMKMFSFALFGNGIEEEEEVAAYIIHLDVRDRISEILGERV